MIAFAALLWVPTIGDAADGKSAEIKLSEAPIADIFSLILENGNTSPGTDEVPARYEFKVLNDTSDDSIWRLRTEMLTPIAFEFSLAKQAGPFFASSFKSRPQLSHASQGPIILSTPVSMEPGSSVIVQAMFEHVPGSGSFPIRLVNEAHNDQIGSRNRIAHGIYFGAMAVFVILFVLSARIIGSSLSLWFGLYLIGLTLLNAHSHGYILSLFALPAETFFPMLRAFQAAVTIGYLIFVMSFLNASERYPAFAWCVRLLVLMIVLGMPLEIYAETERLRIVVDAIALLFLIMGVYSTFLALRDKHRGAGYFAAGYSLLLFVGAVNYVASIPSFAPWNDLVDRFTLTLQSCDALVFGGAIFSQIFSLRAERDAAISEKLVEYREKLAVSQKLRQSETNLQRARTLAERHRASIASTSHDLRQPIASLRVALERAKEASPAMTADVSTGLEFLDSVLTQSLASSRADAEDQPISSQPEGAETVEVQMVLENVRRMFSAEAEQKGVDLRVVPSSLNVRIRVIDLVRIVSNLTANAIRYTETGGVLVGARRRGDGVAIEVWDTGRGIPADELETVMQPYQRGSRHDPSIGEGLGLSIVKQLALDNELSVALCSEIGKGSVFKIDGLRLVQARA